MHATDDRVGSLSVTSVGVSSIVRAQLGSSFIIDIDKTAKQWSWSITILLQYRLQMIITNYVLTSCLRQVLKKKKSDK